MILRVYDCLRKRRCEFPKPEARVTGVWIRYPPDVEAWPWLRYPGQVEWHCMRRNGAVVMPSQFETSALIEDVNAGKARTDE